uniref:Uncharacterized protein n=1 Tax=Lutzomyia longipalpis TaxID=7200 RepID=A0A1B0GK55_LUTLO
MRVVGAGPVDAAAKPGPIAMYRGGQEYDPFYGRDPSEFFETAVHYPVLPPPAVKPKKHRPRLHINLGRLGRHAATDHIEPTRLREDLNIHVSNPTFTRENLSKRNYDAFFESGEPVYSLEKRVPPSHETEPPSPSIPEEPQRHSLGLFHHRPRVPPRARSADPEGALEASQKGDRCPLEVSPSE